MGRGLYIWVAIVSQLVAIAVSTLTLSRLQQMYLGFRGQLCPEHCGCHGRSYTVKLAFSRTAAAASFSYAQACSCLTGAGAFLCIVL